MLLFLRAALLCLGSGLCLLSPLAVAAPPVVSATAPDFALADVAGRKITLSALGKEGPVVLLVLRGWPGYQCPVCSRQMHAFVQKAGEFATAGARVALVYPGPAERLGEHAAEFVAKTVLPKGWSFLLDPDFSFTKAYDLRWDAPSETAYPSTFVLDRQRKVLFALVSKTHGGRASPEAVLAALAPPGTASVAADTIPPTPASDYTALVTAADRDAADKAMDVGRQPAAMLAFVGVRPGQKVAELMAGRGYTAELLARAVGKQGRVYGQNNAFVVSRFAARPWSERLSKPVCGNIVRLDRELEDPFPAELKNLDLVVMNLFYHDAIWFQTDRKAMNAAVFRALKPGGRYVVIDHSAKAGAGVSVAKSLHRVEENVVRAEITAAGFALTASSDFLRHPADTRDGNALDGEKRGATDRFALSFRKP